MESSNSSNVYPDSIRPFYGMGPPEDPVQWLMEFERNLWRIRDANLPTEEDIVERYLAGRALAWWKASRHNISGLIKREDIRKPSFHEAFLARFVPLPLVVYWKQQVRQARWCHNESIHDYIWRFGELLDRIVMVCPGFEAEATRCFLNGLPNREFLSPERLRACTSYNDAVQALELLIYLQLVTGDVQPLTPPHDAPAAPPSSRLHHSMVTSHYMPHLPNTSATRIDRPADALDKDDFDNQVNGTDFTNSKVEEASSTVFNNFNTKKTPPLSTHSVGKLALNRQRLGEVSATLCSSPSLSPSLDVLSKHTLTYLDVQVGTDEIGRIEILLYDDIAPRTARNFAYRCRNANGIGYKGSVFHRVSEEESRACASCIISDNEVIPTELNECQLVRESSALKHDRRGVVSMCYMSHTHLSKSAFFICLKAHSAYDATNTAFGMVVSGWHIIDNIEDASTKGGAPSIPIKIVDSGVVLSTVD